MGHKHSKKKLESIIGSSYTCPSCEQIFDPSTPTKEVNEHIINCSHSPTSLSSNELYTPLSLNLKPSGNNTFSSKSNAKLNPLRIKDYINLIICLRYVMVIIYYIYLEEMIKIIILEKQSL